MRRSVLGVLFGVLALGAFGQAVAQDAVESAAIRDAFVQVLPRGWSVTDFVVEVQENYGTAIEPDIRSRFNATVQLSEDLFAVVGELDGAVLLRPTARAGETRVFYGVSASTRQAGGWRTTFNLENDPTVGLGQVAGAYSGQVLIEGSEAEAAFRATLEARARVAQEEALRATQRAEELRAEERKGELAEAAHEVALEEATRQAEREAQVAAEAHEASMREQQRAQAEAERLTREAELAALAAPVPDIVREHIRLALPTFWELGEVPLDDGVVTGSFDAPEVTHRFEAPVTLREDLFIDGGSFGGVPLITRVETSGADRLVRGVSTATWSGSRWHVALELEPLDGLRSGAPRDQFVAHAVITGSPDETALRERVAAQQADLSRQLESLEAALAGGSMSAREAAMAQALGSSHDAVVGVALRHALSDMSSFAIDLSLFDADLGDETMLEFLNDAGSTGLQLEELDLATGALTGVVNSNLAVYNQRRFTGSIVGRHVTFVTLQGDVTGVFDLTSPDRLEGQFHYRDRPPLRAVIHLR